MPNLKNRYVDQTKRLINRHMRLEICAVYKVNFHKEPDDHLFNSVDVIMRDRAKKAATDKCHIRERLPVIPTFIGGHCQGYTRSPRVGDLVWVFFYHEQKGVVLGPANSWAEYPACRPTPYDIADKGGQWMEPVQDRFGDFIKQPYPETKKPYCFRWFHGPIKGNTGPGRDWCWLFDYCQMGDCIPSCKDCKTIDSIQRLKNQYLKFYSEETESRKAYPYRAEFHAHCGSFWMFESKDRPSLEYLSEAYTEGEGYWALQGARIENNAEAFKGHVRHHPHGTLEIHSTTEDKPIASEATGTRVVVVAPDDNSVDYAAEIKDFVTGAFIRIMKSGEIVLYSPTKITLDAPQVEETADNKTSGDNAISGKCSHGSCSCDGCSGGSTGTGSVQAIAHGLVDDKGNKIVPGEVSCCCTAAGGSCAVQYCDDTYIYAICSNGIAFIWKVRR